MLAIGQNDFAPAGPAYDDIYDGTWDEEQKSEYVSTVVDNIDTALATLSADGVQLVVSNIADYGVAPITKIFYPNATQRDEVTAVIADANRQIEQLAQEYRLPMIDLNGLATTYLGTNKEPVASLTIGGVVITNTAGVAPTNAFVHDGVHIHTLLQAALRISSFCQSF